MGQTLEAELRHLPRPGLQGQTGGAGLGGPGENPHTGRVDEGGGAGRAEMLFLVKILTPTMLVMMLSNKPKSKVKCLTPIMPVRLRSNKQRQEAGKGFTRRLVFVVFVSSS